MAHRYPAFLSRVTICLGLALTGAEQAVATSATQARTLADLSLEELAAIQITSVSGKAESLQNSPAAVFVITGEDIRRSAATSLPEALRLAPNLQVVRLNAAQYAITARGFNNSIGNKLLVLIDGRTVYSALYSGVFWDSNEVPLEDIDRIEVISGPGGTIWGVNAVNGVINIITKPAELTQGTLLASVRSVKGGYVSARYGGELNNGGHYRLYALLSDHGASRRSNGLERTDNSSKQQLGFRVDLGPPSDKLTLQGDIFDGGRYPSFPIAPKISGANLLARWEHALADGSPFKLQAYVDRTSRDETTTFRNQEDTAEVQFTHEPVLDGDHSLLWGATYRRTSDSNNLSPLVAFMPAQRSLSWLSVFTQYDRQLTDSLKLTAGAKFERNVYTGFEFMPNLRLSWQHSDNELTWAALSRAVRAPARLDKELFAPGQEPFVIRGGPEFESEIANVFEVGHRGFASRDISYSIAAFEQRYDKLRSSTGLPVIMVENKIEGDVYGIEGWTTWKPSSDWRLSAGYLGLRKKFRLKQGSTDTAGFAAQGNDPRQQWSLRSSLDVGSRGELDLTVRHVGTLPSPSVPSYTAVDGRFAWRLSPELEASIIVQNLFDKQHIEFRTRSVSSVIERKVFLKLVWQL